MSQNPLVEERDEPATRLDASMSLISDLFRRPLDEGYVEAASRRRDSDGSTVRGPWLSLIVLTAVGLLLAVAGLQVRHNAGESSSERSQLIKRIEATTLRNDELEGTAQNLEAEIDQLQAARLDLASTGEIQAASLTHLRTHVGTSNVVGPGIVVTVDDAKADGDPTPGDGYDESRVSDLDLQHVVNGLWEAGAEAVSVNGQRITPLSAIRSARDVISVNYRPLSPPYEISAIGDQRMLATKFGDGTGGAWLQAISSLHGIRYNVQNRDELELPAASVTLRHLEETN
jgi:uncharacterized protein YlxW (UPF0749 family)